MRFLAACLSLFFCLPALAQEDFDHRTLYQEVFVGGGMQMEGTFGISRFDNTNTFQAYPVLTAGYFTKGPFAIIGRVGFLTPDQVPLNIRFGSLEILRRVKVFEPSSIVNSVGVGAERYFAHRRFCGQQTCGITSEMATRFLLRFRSDRMVGNNLLFGWDIWTGLGVDESARAVDLTLGFTARLGGIFDLTGIKREDKPLMVEDSMKRFKCASLHLGQAGFIAFDYEHQLGKGRGQVLPYASVGVGLAAYAGLGAILANTKHSPDINAKVHLFGIEPQISYAVYTGYRYHSPRWGTTIKLGMTLMTMEPPTQIPVRPFDDNVALIPSLGLGMTFPKGK